MPTVQQALLRRGTVEFKCNQPFLTGQLIKVLFRPQLLITKLIDSDICKSTQHSCVASATGWSENREFSKPVIETDRARAQPGRGLACLL
jgi:hypothetical protein